VLGIMLILDVVALFIAVVNPVQTFGTVQSGDIFAGDPYLHRMHQEFSVSDVFIAPRASTTAQRVLFAVSHGVAFTLAVIPMLIMARRLIAGVLAEDPFTLRTVRRLRVLGAIVLAGGAASELTEYVTARVLLDSAVPAGHMRTWAHPDFHLTLWWLMPGLVLLAFAEIVRRGQTLRNELDTVI